MHDDDPKSTVTETGFETMSEHEKVVGSMVADPTPHEESMKEVTVGFATPALSRKTSTGFA